MSLRQLYVSYLPRVGIDFHQDTPLNTPAASGRVAIQLLATEASEVFAILCLSTKHHLLAYHVVARGSLDSVTVHPREVFKAAILANAACIIGCHNHPSGDPSPSADDIAITRKLAEAGQLLGIDLVDHIIVGDNRYFSFKESGQL